MTKVLYVEDEALLAISMEGVLMGAGHIVELAYDGEEGLAQAVSFSPDVIVTDYMMPRMDGPTMLKEIRKLGILAPVILTTAVPERDIKDDVREWVNLYLAKPFRDQELVDAVARLAAPLA